ncbi:MAG: PAS domain-containing protein [Gammaproteobacteria bacterium]|nr:PAS domain-containing protein [Gammaproteobacteria bacterium]
MSTSPAELTATAELREQTRLRRVAENLLTEGQAPPTRGWEIGTDALALLYRLASDCNSSDDALAVLHELQVHQVELDLQLQQLETNEDELNEELQRYRNLFDQAPVGYLLLRPDGSLIEANQTAGELLAKATGRHNSGSIDTLGVDSLIKAESRPAFHALLQQLDVGHPVASCELEAVDAAPGAPALRITARREPDSHNIWITLS